MRIDTLKRSRDTFTGGTRTGTDVDGMERGGPRGGPESERRNFRSIRGRAKTPVLCKSRCPVPVINYSLG